MAALDPLGRKRRSVRRRCAAIAVVLTVSALLPESTGAAAGAPMEPKDTKQEYAKLKKRADALSKEYRGELVSLDQAKGAADKAEKDAERLTREFNTARADISRLAASSYMRGSLDMMPVSGDGDPSRAIRDMSTVEALARNSGRRIQNLDKLSQDATRSQQAAETKLAAVRREIDDLESQRARVKKLLAKYKPEVPNGGKPDGVHGTKSPIIGNSMTARMRKVLLEIDGKFGPFPAIGCSRPGDPQDHGTGTACDFMESSGGKMPSSSAKAHGDTVAQYVISNASRLGIKYVIWRQRIYDMRGSGAWKPMEDRGSITANHFDHVHVSVL